MKQLQLSFFEFEAALLFENFLRKVFCGTHEPEFKEKLFGSVCL